MRCGRARLPIFVKAFAGRLACPIYPTLCVLVAEPRSDACQVPVTFISIRHQIYDPEWPFLAIAIEAHFDWCHGLFGAVREIELAKHCGRTCRHRLNLSPSRRERRFVGLCYLLFGHEPQASGRSGRRLACSLLILLTNERFIKGAAARLVGKSLSAIWGEHRRPLGWEKPTEPFLF